MISSDRLDHCVHQNNMKAGQKRNAPSKYLSIAVNMTNSELRRHKNDINLTQPVMIALTHVRTNLVW